MTVATKMGRRVPQDPAEYTLANFRAWTDRSRANLGMDTLDLVQLHCPPTPVFSTDAVYDALDTLVAEKRIAAYGVSVETCAEALAAIARPGTASVQIIFNAFRRKPLEEVLPAAQAAGVGIIARVPLASGLLSGRYTHDTTFDASDHRNYNRHGEAFDVGETFSGVDFDTGVDAAQEFAALLPAGRRPGTGRAALDHPAAGCHHCDPGRAEPRAGAAERRRGGPAAAHRRATARHRGDLRPADPSPGPPALVTSRAGRRARAGQRAGRPLYQRRRMTASQAWATVVPWIGLIANSSLVRLTISQPSANAAGISSSRTRRGPQTPGCLSLKHIM